MKPNHTTLASACFISSALVVAALLGGCSTGAKSTGSNVDAAGNRIGPPPETTPATTNTPPVPGTNGPASAGTNSTSSSAGNATPVTR